MTKTFQNKVITNFLFTLFLLAIISAISFYTIDRLNFHSKLVSNTHNILENLENLETIVNRAIRGQRGYLLTGDEEFLQAYNSTQYDATNLAAEIRKTVQDHPVQKSRVDSLSTLLQQLFLLLDDHIQLVKEGNTDLAIKFTREKTGLKKIRQIEVLIQSFINEEKQILHERSIVYGRFRNVTPYVIILFSLIALLIVLFSYRIIANEIKRRESLQQELEDKKNYYLAILEKFPIPIWRTNANGQLDYVNAGWSQFTGRSISINKGIGWQDILHPADKPMVFPKLMGFIEEKKHFNTVLRVKNFDGEYRWVRNIGRPFYNEGNAFIGFLGFLIDITDEKNNKEKLEEAYCQLKETNRDLARAEEHLKKLNNQLELKVEERTKEISEIIESLPQLVWTTDPEGNLNYANQVWYNYTGLSPEIAKNEGWNDILHPEDRENDAHLWSESVRNLTPYNTEYRLRNRNGEYKWFLSRGTPLLNKKGEVIKWFGTSTDIQDQKDKTTELERANEELKKINRDLDNFIYTASHDLKTPIVNLEGLNNLLVKKLSHLGPEILQILKLFENSIVRLKTTIGDLSKIYEVHKEEIEDETEIDLYPLIENILDDYDELIKKNNVHFEWKLEVSRINFSRKYIRSILTNLISNAIKYSSPERKAKVLIASRFEDGHLKLTVADNGLGLAPKQKEKIFGMFKRFHTHVEGTGIGLYLVKRIIDDARGKIEVESTPDEGTTFNLYFPTD